MWYGKSAIPYFGQKIVRTLITARRVEVWPDEGRNGYSSSKPSSPGDLGSRCGWVSGVHVQMSMNESMYVCMYAFTVLWCVCPHIQNMYL